MNHSFCSTEEPLGRLAGSAGIRRVAVILQPSYLPWLGYFAQLHQSDVFVVYDDVQFDKHGWRNRNRIKTAQGAQWLTVPVCTHGKNHPANSEVLIDNTQPWRKKHLDSIRQSYARAPYVRDYLGIFEEIYSREWLRLLDLNMAFFRGLSDALGLRREILFASELDVQGDPVSRLIDICRKVGASHFFEGASGKDYIDGDRFADAGVTLEYQNYQHPVYPQLHGPFLPFLSIVDLLFNCGPRSLEILVS